MTKHQSTRIICPNCGAAAWKELGRCLQCRAEFDKEDEANLAVEREEINKAIESNDWSKVPPPVIEKHAKGIILTTSISVANREIKQELGIIAAECVFGMNIFRDFFAHMRDFFGGRSAATQNVLGDARKIVLIELRREALMLSADAVIAVDLDYQELSGGQKNGMLMIVASGTAVKLSAED